MHNAFGLLLDYSPSLLSLPVFPVPDGAAGLTVTTTVRLTVAKSVQ